LKAWRAAKVGVKRRRDWKGGALSILGGAGCQERNISGQRGKPEPDFAKRTEGSGSAGRSYVEAKGSANEVRVKRKFGGTRRVGGERDGKGKEEG